MQQGSARAETRHTSAKRARGAPGLRVRILILLPSAREQQEDGREDEG
jgi:hypothetical protein